MDSVSDAMIDTESPKVEVQIVKTPSRGQLLEKKKRWTLGFGGSAGKKVTPVSKEVEMKSQDVHSRQPLHQQRTRKSCMAKPYNINKYSILNSAPAPVKRSKEVCEAEAEIKMLDGDAEDLERGLEERSVLSMGVSKRAKSSHKPLLELQVVQVAPFASPADSRESGLFSA